MPQVAKSWHGKCDMFGSDAATLLAVTPRHSACAPGAGKPRVSGKPRLDAAADRAMIVEAPFRSGRCGVGRLSLEPDSDRTVIHQLDVHAGAELPRLHLEPVLAQKHHELVI